MTSNGYSVRFLPDELLKDFSDIDISYDFPTKWENDKFRGPRCGELALEALEKLRRLKVETSIATCMTNKNYDRISRMVEIARTFQVNLRVNIYKPVRNSSLKLSYDQFWKGIEALLVSGELISCSEPIVNTILGSKISVDDCSCGKNSFRITPEGYIVPCVYWKTKDASIDLLISEGKEAIWNSESFRRIHMVPEDCMDCDQKAYCRGGCAARRYYSSDFMKPDPFCYEVRGLPKPKLSWKMAEPKNLIHASYLCTIIVK